MAHRVSLYPLDAEDLGFHIVIWDVKKQVCERTLAACVSVGLAHAAYAQALIDYGHHEQILLKIGARVIRDSMKTSDVKA